MQGWVEGEWNVTSLKDTQVEMGVVLEDIGSYRTRDTNYMNILTMYSELKNLLRKAIMEHEEEKKYILL